MAKDNESPAAEELVHAVEHEQFAAGCIRCVDDLGNVDVKTAWGTEDGNRPLKIIAGEMKMLPGIMKMQPGAMKMVFHVMKVLCGAIQMLLVT